MYRVYTMLYTVIIKALTRFDLVGCGVMHTVVPSRDTNSSCCGGRGGSRGGGS